MEIEKKWNILFIKDQRSLFNTNTEAFSQLFKNVDFKLSAEEALAEIESSNYDMIISDLTQNQAELVYLKQIKDKKEEQCIFTMLSPKDSDKLYKIADLGINAFEIEPEQFELALQEIAKFDPYAPQQ